MPGRPAVFLDRDGTLVRELEHRRCAEPLELLPGAAEAVARLVAAERAVVVVTNQSAIARGWLTPARLAEQHAALEAALERAGGRVDAFRHCPHHPEAGEPPLRADCACRKPKPGMLRSAARELGLDLARSWTIGDAARDLEAGRAAGTRTVLVATGKGAAERKRLAAAGRLSLADALVPDVAAAVEHLLAADRAQGR